MSGREEKGSRTVLVPANSALDEVPGIGTTRALDNAGLP